MRIRSSAVAEAMKIVDAKIDEVAVAGLKWLKERRRGSTTRDTTSLECLASAHLKAHQNDVRLSLMRGMHSISPRMC